MLLSLIGPLVMGKNRASHLLTLLANLGALVAHVLYTVPAMNILGKAVRASPIVEAECLRNVALGHLVGLLACVFGVALQMGTLEEEEVEVESPTKKKVKKNQ